MAIKDKKIIKITKYAFGMGVFFFVMAGLGILLYRFRTEEISVYVDGLAEEFSFFTDLSFLQAFLVIFINNSVKVFASILLGVAFGLIPLFFVGFNGFFLGLVGAHSYGIPGVEIGDLFVGLFFHGIFELTAVFIGGALGLHLGVTFYKELNKEEECKFNPIEVNWSCDDKIKYHYSDIIFGDPEECFSGVITRDNFKNFITTPQMRKNTGDGKDFLNLKNRGLFSENICHWQVTINDEDSKKKGLSLSSFRNIKKIKNNPRLWEELKYSINVFAYICLPLLLLAAVIEAILLVIVL